MKVRARLIRKRRRFSEPQTNAPAAASALPQVCTVARHARGEPSLRHAAAAARAAHADRVRLIDDQFGAVAFGKRGKIGKRRAVAFHAENAFDHDHARSGNGQHCGEVRLREHSDRDAEK